MAGKSFYLVDICYFPYTNLFDSGRFHQGGLVSRLMAAQRNRLPGGIPSARKTPLGAARPLVDRGASMSPGEAPVKGRPDVVRPQLLPSRSTHGSPTECLDFGWRFLPVTLKSMGSPDSISAPRPGQVPIPRRGAPACQRNRKLPARRVGNGVQRWTTRKESG